jgi:DNA-binding CsgD family transcriptional regulator
MAIAWGIRAATLADQLGLVEARLHALTSVAVARIGLGDERGWAEHESCLREARLAGLEDHAGRAYAALVPCAVTACRLSVAERYFLEGTAFCLEHDLDSYRLYLLGWRAVQLLRRGRWPEASAVASTVLSHPHVSAISRIQALVALGCVHARRGAAGASMDALDEALRLAFETAELQRLGPVRAARAEAAWLAGNREAALLEAQAGFDLAVKHDHHVITGELAHWLWRSGGLSSRPATAMGPFALQLDQGWSAAAQHWHELGCPYEAALAMADGDEAAMRQALQMFEDLGALPMAAAVARRLRELGVAGIRRGPRSVTRANAAGLTPRELEVLRLVAAGHTSREIGQKLFLSTRTVDMHVANSLGKLGTRSRAEAVRRAAELQLLESQGT